MGAGGYTVRVYLVWRRAGAYSTRFGESGFGTGVNTWRRNRVWRMIGLDREDRRLWWCGGCRLYRKSLTDQLFTGWFHRWTR